MALNSRQRGPDSGERPASAEKYRTDRQVNLVYQTDQTTVGENDWLGKRQTLEPESSDHQKDRGTMGVS